MTKRCHSADFSTFASLLFGKNVKKVGCMMNEKHRRYIRGLNGLRTFAVLGVIFYHLLPQTMRGGYLGVPIFFAISGYLITDHLVLEYRAKGKIDLKDFFVRRLRRLYPTLALVMISCTAYITLFQRNLLNNLKGTFLSIMLFVDNWYQIGHGSSYFERFSNASPFTHMWYVAVEFQNYIIWLILFLLMMKLTKNRGQRFVITLVLAVASAVAMAILYQPGTDPSRVYYGTDTRVFAIWLGSALAFTWPSDHLRAHIHQNARYFLNGVGIGSFLLLAVSFFYLDAKLDFLYYGGFFLISILSVLLVAVVVHPGANLDRWLSNPLFDYIGSRSYGIYLWQYPVMIFYEAKVKNLAAHLWQHTLVELLLILLLAEGSYRLLKHRSYTLDPREWWASLQDWWLEAWLSVKKLRGLVTMLVVAVAIVGLVIAPNNYVDAKQEAMQKEAAANTKIAEETKQAEKPVVTTTSDQRTELAQKYGVTDAQIEKAAANQYTFFGDSVMLGAAADMNEVFPNSVVDAAINRQVYTSAPDFQALKDKGLLHDTVIIGLGTNGLFNEQQFADVMTVLEKRKVYWVNMRAPGERTQGAVNEMLNQMAAKYSNLTIIDWYSFSIQQAGWFYEDQTHLNPDGRLNYTQLMINSLVK